MAVQEGLTSIKVSWSPPSPLGNTTGYRVYYNSDSDNGSEDVSGGSTNNYLLTGLQNGTSYTISIVGTSLNLPSDKQQTNVRLGNVTVRMRWACCNISSEMSGIKGVHTFAIHSCIIKQTMHAAEKNYNIFSILLHVHYEIQLLQLH